MERGRDAFFPGKRGRFSEGRCFWSDASSCSRSSGLWGDAAVPVRKRRCVYVCLSGFRKILNCLYNLRNKEYKAVTEAVPFQKILMYSLGTNMHLLGLNKVLKYTFWKGTTPVTAFVCFFWEYCTFMSVILNWIGHNTQNVERKCNSMSCNSNNITGKKIINIFHSQVCF